MAPTKKFTPPPPGSRSLSGTTQKILGLEVGESTEIKVDGEKQEAAVRSLAYFWGRESRPKRTFATRLNTASSVMEVYRTS